MSAKASAADKSTGYSIQSPRIYQPRGLPDPLLLAAHIVHQYIFPQRLRRRIKRPPLVYLRHLLDEVGHVVAALKHEGVDSNPLAGAAHYFPQSLLDRPVGGRVVEEDIAVLKVGGRLAVRDLYYLSVGVLAPAKQGACEHQR